MHVRAALFVFVFVFAFSGIVFNQLVCSMACCAALCVCYLHGLFSSDGDLHILMAYTQQLHGVRKKMLTLSAT